MGEPVKYVPGPGERLIHLTRGFVTIVNERHYDMLMQYRWRVQDGRNGTYYAVTGTGGRGRKPKIIMQRLITNAPKGSTVDHEDEDGLNNRDDNLTVCGYNENAHASSRRVGVGISGYRGVEARGPKFRARIKIDGKQVLIGTYDDRIEAAMAYDAKAREIYGDFAWQNFQTSRNKEPVEAEEIPF